MNKLSAVYHGEQGIRTLKELARSYLTITRDLTRVMSRLKAIYRGWAFPCAGEQVYAPRYRAEWACEDLGSRCTSSCGTLLRAVRHLGGTAPRSATGTLSGKPETSGHEITAADSP